MGQSVTVHVGTSATPHVPGSRGREGDKVGSCSHGFVTPGKSRCLWGGECLACLPEGVK